MVISTLPPLLPRVDAILILDGDGNRLAGKYYGDFLTSTSSSSQPDESNNNTSSSKSKPNLTVEDLRSSFERQLQNKIQGIAASPDAAEVITVMNKTAVFCGGSTLHGASAPLSSPHSPKSANANMVSHKSSSGDVRVVHIGPTSESELLLAHLCESMYEALGQLMGGQLDKSMVLDNLELVFLLIDEHCDGGIILEVDPNKLAGSVLLKDEEEDGQMMNGMEGQGAGGVGSGGNMMNMNGMNSGGLNIGRPGGDITLAQAFRQARAQLIAGLTSPEGM